MMIMMMMMMIMMAMMIKYDNDNLVPHQNNFQEGPVKEKKLLFTGQQGDNNSPCLMFCHSILMYSSLSVRD